MKDLSELKFVSIGFGFLAGYLYPCYGRFCPPENLEHQIAAVTADADTLEGKRRQYPFSIYLNENEKALSQIQPDVILFSPPPSVAPELARQVLEPYYASLRGEGRKLPDLYAFPPSPQGKFYLDLLGQDVHVCNILPNMTREIGGMALSGAEGNTYVTLPKEGKWPEENLRVLEKIFEPLGEIIYAEPDTIRDILAAMCVAEALPLACFAITDGLNQGGGDWTPNAVARAMRAIHQDTWQYHPRGSTPCDADGVAEDTRRGMEGFIRAWTQGGVDYLTHAGVDLETARKVMVSNVDLRLHIAQVERRQAVEKTLKDHATKGGVAERGRLCYELLVEKKLRAAFAGSQNGGQASEAETFFRDVSFEICQIVAVHGKRMAGEAISVKYTPEHHAVLYALFVRNAKALEGKAGEDAAHRGTLLYADQRGARMAKRCLARGDSLTPFGYMAYGEWAPEPGTMEARDVAFDPDVVTEAYVCPWLTAWERKGFLEEGVAYCGCIDYHLVKGFHKDLELTVESTRTEGGACCRFVWKGFALDERARKALAEKKAELGDTCRKDWLYHTRHLFSAMSEKIAQLPQGEKIVRKTLDEFEILYGKASRDEIARVADMDFYQI